MSQKKPTKVGFKLIIKLSLSLIYDINYKSIQEKDEEKSCENVLIDSALKTKDECKCKAYYQDYCNEYTPSCLEEIIVQKRSFVFEFRKELRCEIERYLEREPNRIIYDEPSEKEQTDQQDDRYRNNSLHVICLCILCTCTCFE